jgi:hypothetical protein
MGGGSGGSLVIMGGPAENVLISILTIVPESQFYKTKVI